jgi:hypothetical protein
MSARHTLRRHHPRKRMIQYTGKVVFDHQRRGVLGRPVKPGDDTCGMDGAS